MSDFDMNKLGGLLNTASKKLGIPTDELKEALSNPKKASALLSQLDYKTGGKISSTDPASLEEIINNNPKAKKIYDNLKKGKKNG